MDSNTLTHVAAVLVGVLVTYFLVTGSQGQKTVETSRSAPVASGGGASKSQKKKKKKSKAKNGSGDDDDADEEPAVTSREVPAPAPAATKSKAKSKAKAAAPKEEEKKEEDKNANGKKKKKKAKNPANGNAAEKKAAEKTNGSSKKENEPKAANAPAPAVVNEPVLDEWQKAPQEEEWNDVVETKKKKKNRPKPAKPAAAAATPAEAPAPAPSSSESIVVDAKKIGIIIGPKGATMQAIQEATGCNLDINAPPKDDKAPAPKASVAITGPDKESCQKAKKAINELATKGYASILQGDGFGEFSIEVHPRFLSEIVGPGGATIRALQTTLDVKITIPSTDWKPNAVQVGKVKMARVGIAGAKDKAKECKEAIRSLMEYHHHEITHPGCIHEEVYVPQEFFHCVIGPRGSEIKHIRGNYKVDVYMPNADSNTENVLVVGKQANVDKAISYIQLLMERDTEQREKKYSDEYY